MISRKNHTPKTQSQRQVYNRYIERLDYDPTVDDALNFPNSTKPGEELSEPTSKRKRRINTGERFIDHFKENWLNWLIGAFIIVFLWLMVDSKIDLAKISVTLENLKDNLSEVEQINQKNLDKNIDQDLRINEHKMKIESLEKKTDNKSK